MEKQGTLALLLLIIGTIYLTGHKNESSNLDFENWKNQFHISYESELEEIYRRRVFEENLLLIKKHNADPTATYKMGINQFTAMTKEEFVERYLGVLPTAVKYETVSDTNEKIQLASDVDWVSQGAVNPPKNQGQCGSCWAFSATGSLEGLSKVATGKLRSFSEQQLMDCSGRYGNMGCNGGTMGNAFKYVKQNGICEDATYPYKGAKQECKASTSCTNPFKISNYAAVTGGCLQLQNVLSHQPVSVTVDATNWSSYSSGVFNKCSTNLNHGVLLVGHIGGIWKIKNSWGSVWGEHGYIRLADGNTCGLCQAASYPIY